MALDYQIEEKAESTSANESWQELAAPARSMISAVMQVGRTKLRAPTAGGVFVRRERLSRSAASVRTSRLTLVQAPAGYGKTTLLSEWHRAVASNGIAAWLSMDSSEQTVFDVFAAIIRALEAAGVPVSDLKDFVGADGFATARALAIATSNLLVDVDGAIFLFIDDVHVLKGRAGEEALRELLDHLPLHAHLIIAARELPALALGRLRARGELTEIYADDLRFTSDEARELFLKAGHLGLAPEHVDEISSRTEGWVSGLRLASIALEGNDPAALLRTGLSGRRRTFEAFFAEEVLSRQSSEVQEFLLKTAPLSQICAELADAVTGNDNGRAMIAEIEARGLFLFSLDAEGVWYRYHHLFSDFLLRRLGERDPALAPALCARASQWFENRGNLVEAFDHAIRANDEGRAAELLDRRCQSVLYSGDFATLEGLVEQISSPALGRFPRILLTRAWLDIIRWRFADAETALLMAKRHIDQAERTADKAEDHHPILFIYYHHEAMLALFTDRIDDAETCLNDLRDIPITDEYLHGTIFDCDIYIASQKFVRTDTDALSARATTHYRRSGSIFVTIWHQTIAGIAFLRAGNIQRASEVLEEALQVGIRIGGEKSSLAAMPALLLAEAYYLGGRSEEAAGLLADYYPLRAHLGFVDQLVAGLRVSLRLRLAVAAEAARHQVREGRSHVAERFIRPGDLADALDRHSPYPGCSSGEELKAILAVRLAQSSGAYSEAGRVARRWQTFAQKVGWFRSAIDWAVLAAELDIMNGDRLKGLRTLKEAAELALPSGIVSPFLDEGEIVMSVLREHAGEGTPVDDFFVSLVSRHDQSLGNLLRDDPSSNALDEGDLTQMMDALTAKEIEILRGVGNGRLNREIANNLGLTEGSIKWYLNRIYAKIGVARRAQAVKRARQLGLIN